MCERFTKLRTPFTCIVAGATGSGKTEFVLRLLKHRDVVLHPPPGRVIYSYERYQPKFDGISGVEFVKGSDYALRRGDNTLLIIDDQMGGKGLRPGKVVHGGQSPPGRQRHFHYPESVRAVQGLPYRGAERSVPLSVQVTPLFIN